MFFENCEKIEKQEQIVDTIYFLLFFNILLPSQTTIYFITFAKDSCVKKCGKAAKELFNFSSVFFFNFFCSLLMCVFVCLCLNKISNNLKYKSIKMQKKKNKFPFTMHDKA